MGIILFLFISMSTAVPYVYGDEIERVTSTSTTVYYVPYGNGIDDNGDGIIDDLNESDVEQGTLPVNRTYNVFDDWNMTYDYHNATTGVKMGGVYENLAIVEVNGSSLNPTYSAKYVAADAINRSSYGEWNDVVPLLKFKINVSSSDIMTGCQEFYYRSPIKWNDDYDEYILNIYDDEGNLVYAIAEYPFIGSIDNTSDKCVRENRTYFKIQMNLKSDTEYTFYEYVQTVDDDPINEVYIYFAPYQDIASDGLTDSYFFPGTLQSTKIETEVSWSMIFHMGIGAAGTERVIIGDNDPSADHTINIQGIYSENSTEINQVTIIMPIRTSTPLNITIDYHIESGVNSVDGWIEPAVVGLTGTLIYTFNFTDPDNTKPNDYYITIYITNLDDTDDVMTYVMYPEIVGGNATNHNVCYPSSITGPYYEIYHFAVHLELYETFDAGGGVEEDDSNTNTDWLLGAAYLLGGCVLIALAILAAPIIPLAIGLGVIGGYLIYNGLAVLTDTDLPGLIPDLASGIVRALRLIYDGLQWIGEQLYKIGILVYESLIEFGEWAIENAGLILEGIAAIVYFVLFLAFIWLSAYFYRILWAIGHLDPFLIQKISKEASSDISGVSKKIGRFGKRIKKLRRK